MKKTLFVIRLRPKNIIMSATIDVTTSTKSDSSLYAFRIFVFSTVFSRRSPIELTLGFSLSFCVDDYVPAPALLNSEHKEKKHALRNLFDGFVYMEKCFVVGWE